MSTPTIEKISIMIRKDIIDEIKGMRGFDFSNLRR